MTTSPELTAEDLEDLHPLGKMLPLRNYLEEIWARRDFLLTVPMSELRAQNQNTFLGNAWHLLNPLLLTAVFYLVFGVILEVGRGIENYPAFLVVGVLTFGYTQKLIMSGTRTIVANIRLIQSLSFPRAILPLAATISEFVAQIPAILAMAMLTLLTVHEWPTLAWLLVIPSLALQTVFGAGLAFVSARLTFHFRDTQQLLPYLLRILLYLSGVFFEADHVPEGIYRTIFELNPVYIFIHINRLALLEHTAEGWPWLVGTGWAGLLLVAGFFYFRSHEIEYGNG